MTEAAQTFFEAAKKLAHLNATWPWDGYDGAADLRAEHHRKVRAAETEFNTAYKQMQEARS